MVTRVARVEAVSCDSSHEAAWLERNLLEASLPEWNLALGGQESIVYIKLDGQPASPALTAEHARESAGHAREPVGHPGEPVGHPGEPAGHVGETAGHARESAGKVHYFGPYLGWLRVRQAVSALNRVFPLAYTRAGLRGTQLDMARARRTGPGDREMFIRALCAVLQRQPGAIAQVRRELEELRDRAAGSLGFELAARIQSEMRALEWVTCPQRVTTMDAADFDVYGWSDGVLVRFGIRAGRLRLWSQRCCTRSRAAPGLAVTPAGWAGFAGRNAELAAALDVAGFPQHPPTGPGRCAVSVVASRV
jgi:excinuclease ABC subunit C